MNSEGFHDTEAKLFLFFLRKNLQTSLYVDFWILYNIAKDEESWFQKTI